MAATTQMLADAEAAYHKLQIGAAVVEVWDSNRERIQFKAADLSKLATYIRSLKIELGLITCGDGPMVVYF